MLDKIEKRGLRDVKREFSAPQQMEAGIRIRFSKAFAAIPESLISLNVAGIYNNTGKYIWDWHLTIFFFFFCLKL